MPSRFDGFSSEELLDEAELDPNEDPTFGPIAAVANALIDETYAAELEGS
jgi:hypothetical protein